MREKNNEKFGCTSRWEKNGIALKKQEKKKKERNRGEKGVCVRIKRKQ